MPTDDEFVEVFPPEPVVHVLGEAADMKAVAAAGDQPAHWRADLWANINAALAFANQPPVAGPGSIVFHERDNGQVWTFYFTGGQVWSIDGEILLPTRDRFIARSRYRVVDNP
jgi:hypothetical protein